MGLMVTIPPQTEEPATIFALLKKLCLQQADFTLCQWGLVLIMKMYIAFGADYRESALPFLAKGFLGRSRNGAHE